MTSTTPQSLFDSKGSQLTIGKKIGSGGEGDVFEISSADQKFVAKIYHKSVDTQKQEKLQSMVQGCTDDLKNISAWPIDLIYKGQNGPICGFLMPKISDYVPIHKLYGPSHRKQQFPNVDWNFLIRAAKNVAAAFYVIHKYGYVIGDVNEGNILVRRINKKYFFGYESVKQDEFYFPYSDIEKTFIDLIYFKQKIDKETLQNIKKRINIPKLNRYLRDYSELIKKRVLSVLNDK